MKAFLKEIIYYCFITLRIKMWRKSKRRKYYNIIVVQKLSGIMSRKQFRMINRFCKTIVAEECRQFGI